MDASEDPRPSSSRPRPRWQTALSAGFAALAAVYVLELLAGTAWVQGATSVGAASRAEVQVRESLTLFPGSRVWYVWEGNGGGWGQSPGWSCLVAGLVVFLIVLVPWRLAARSGRPDRPPAGG